MDFQPDRFQELFTACAFSVHFFGSTRVLSGLLPPPLLRINLDGISRKSGILQQLGRFDQLEQSPGTWWFGPRGREKGVSAAFDAQISQTRAGTPDRLPASSGSVKCDSDSTTRYQSTPTGPYAWLHLVGKSPHRNGPVGDCDWMDCGGPSMFNAGAWRMGASRQTATADDIPAPIVRVGLLSEGRQGEEGSLYRLSSSAR